MGLSLQGQVAWAGGRKDLWAIPAAGENHSP